MGHSILVIHRTQELEEAMQRNDDLEHDIAMLTEQEAEKTKGMDKLSGELSVAMGCLLGSWRREASFVAHTDSLAHSLDATPQVTPRTTIDSKVVLPSNAPSNILSNAEHSIGPSPF